MTWRDYHEATKHSAESLRRARYTLDWANMPDPFRHYEGVPVIDLPADPPAPEIAAIDVLQGRSGPFVPRDGAALLSQLLFYSAAISASKSVPSTGGKYALRVNPSSGNLHPTEFHFITRGLSDWPDGLYHYRPASHMAEQRALGSFAIEPSARIVFLLTSIAWREAWKYRNRAYRYCLHDIGHAWQALELAARALGWECRAVGHFDDDEVARQCAVNEDEWPMLLVALDGPLPPYVPPSTEARWFGGRANALSYDVIEYPLIAAVHEATKMGPQAVDEFARAGMHAIHLPPPASSSRAFGAVVRARRSALDFQGGELSMSLAHLSAILAAALRPFTADFAGAPLIRLYLYAHRVEGLERGVYRYEREREGLELLRAGDQRVAAAGLSLGQDLAGNACIAFSMVADLDRADRVYGARGYRYAHFEAGAIGQRMYVAAEALGFGATGIGAFFDDQVHRYLSIAPEDGQVVYHFAIGYPVPDPRLNA